MEGETRQKWSNPSLAAERRKQKKKEYEVKASLFLAECRGLFFSVGFCNFPCVKSPTSHPPGNKGGSGQFVSLSVCWGIGSAGVPARTRFRPVPKSFISYFPFETPFGGKGKGRSTTPAAHFTLRFRITNVQKAKKRPRKAKKGQDAKEPHPLQSRIHRLCPPRNYE